MGGRRRSVFQSDAKSLKLRPIPRETGRMRRISPSSGSGRKKQMGYQFDGRDIETTATGFLVNQDDWSEDLAKHIAEKEGIELTERHWDLIKYLRDEFFNDNGNQPNTRTIMKAMADLWSEKIDQKTLYDLFPNDPSKQGGRIAGLPESKRKGGY